MLNLMVQAAGEPGRQSRTGREVCGGAELMHGPIVAGANAVELHAWREMRNLEHGRQRPAEDEMEQDEAAIAQMSGSMKKGGSTKSNKYKPLQTRNSICPLLPNSSECHLFRRPLAKHRKSFQNS